MPTGPDGKPLKGPGGQTIIGFGAADQPIYAGSGGGGLFGTLKGDPGLGNIDQRPRTHAPYSGPGASGAGGRPSDPEQRWADIFSGNIRPGGGPEDMPEKMTGMDAPFLGSLEFTPGGGGTGQTIQLPGGNEIQVGGGTFGYGDIVGLGGQPIGVPPAGSPYGVFDRGGQPLRPGGAPTAGGAPGAAPGAPGAPGTAAAPGQPGAAAPSQDFSDLPLGERLIAESQQSWEETKLANEQRYEDILADIGATEERLLGETEGLGEQRAADITQAAESQRSENRQWAISHGLLGTSVFPTMQAGTRFGPEGEDAALNRLNDMLKRERMDIIAGTRGAKWGVMERREDVAGMDIGQMADILAQFGEFGEGAVAPAEGGAAAAPAAPGAGAGAAAVQQALQAEAGPGSVGQLVTGGGVGASPTGPLLTASDKAVGWHAGEGGQAEFWQDSEGLRRLRIAEAPSGPVAQFLNSVEQMYPTGDRAKNYWDQWDDPNSPPPDAWDITAPGATWNRTIDKQSEAAKELTKRGYKFIEAPSGKRQDGIWYNPNTGHYLIKGGDGFYGGYGAPSWERIAEQADRTGPPQGQVQGGYQPRTAADVVGSLPLGFNQPAGYTFTGGVGTPFGNW